MLCISPSIASHSWSGVSSTLGKVVAREEVGWEPQDTPSTLGAVRRREEGGGGEEGGEGEEGGGEEGGSRWSTREAASGEADDRLLWCSGVFTLHYIVLQCSVV